MPKNRDADTGIDEVFSAMTTHYPHVVAGMHIGTMARYLPPNITSVLSIGATPGLVRDGVPHRHVPLSYQEMDTAQLDVAVRWVREQLSGERTVLIRSEGGRQRPGLVAALVILDLGGRSFDATSCVHRADPGALTDFRYLRMLYAADDQLHTKITATPAT